MSVPPGPVALVTGASSGIGRATALLLARSGYRVFATVRTPDAEASLRQEAAGLPVEVLTADLLDEPAVPRTVDRVLESAGRVDLLVNNAGYALVGAVEDLPRETIRRQFEVNVFAAMELCRAVLPAMRAQGAGRIVNISSLAGRVSVPLMGAYCATKSALEAFSDALRVEAKPFGVRVVIVEPGPVVTQFQKRALFESRFALASPSAYGPVYREYQDTFETGAGATAVQVARVILRAARARHPRARYRVRLREALLAGLLQVVPKSAMDVGTSYVMGIRQLRKT